LKSVDRPWKLYPVGLLFGLGFDTASSIALLSVAVIAQQDGSEQSSSTRNGNVVLLAFLFTAGMTLVDSLDSCLMIWAYAPDLARNGRKRLAVWEVDDGVDGQDCEGFVESDAVEVMATLEMDDGNAGDKDAIVAAEEVGNDDATCKDHESADVKEEEKSNSKVEACEDLQPKQQQSTINLDTSASKLSLVLTLLSILIAFTIGIVVLLGLIGDQCARCSRAAEKQENSGNGGLEGRWWLAWRRANDNSGYIGAAIVGLFAIAVGTYFTIRWWRARQIKHSSSSGSNLFMRTSLDSHLWITKSSFLKS
jgi:high-affinity nickel-transport protein